MLCEGTIEVGPGNKGFITYPFIIPKNESSESLYNDYEASHLLYHLHKFPDGNPKIDQGSHSSRTMGRLDGHQVSILPNPNSKGALLLSLIKVGRQSVLIQDLAFVPGHN